MAFIKKAKRFAKKVGKRVVRAAKKRYVTKGGPNIKNIYKDVMMLKHLVNIEKKRSDITTTGALVAQFVGAGVSGQYSANITPVLVEGVAQGQRIGQSVKLVSGCLDIQFSQQANSVNDIKVRWYIVCRPDNSSAYTAATSIAQFLEPNPFSVVNDYYSSRDPEYFTAFKVIKSGVVDIKEDPIASGTSIVQKKIPLRFDHHLKFNTDASTTTTKNNMMLFCTASAGDWGLATGVTFSYNMRWYYTDN